MNVIMERAWWVIDPLSRATVTYRPSVQNRLKQNNFQVKNEIATGKTVGLAEWIIHDTCLVVNTSGCSMIVYPLKWSSYFQDTDNFWNQAKDLLVNTLKSSKEQHSDENKPQVGLQMFVQTLELQPVLS